MVKKITGDHLPGVRALPGRDPGFYNIVVVCAARSGC